MVRFCICMLLVIATSASVCGQTQFSGKVIYLPVESQNISTAAKEQAPMKVVIRAKGDQVRWEEFTEKGSRVIITDYTKMEQHVLIEFLGTLCAIESPKDQITHDSPMISQGKKHGKIMERKCFSAEDTSGQIVWTAGPKLIHPFLPNVDGIPVEFWRSTAEGAVLYRAISIIEEVPSDRFFAIPSEYTVVKSDELSELFNLTSTKR